MKLSESLETDGPSYRPGRPGGGMDAGTKRLAMVAAGIGGGLLLLVGAYSLGGRHQGPVPVIEASVAPLRAKPANPGGMQVAGVNEDAFSSGSGQHETMAPAPESPEPQALRAEVQATKKAPDAEAKPAGSLDAAASASVSSPVPADATALSHPAPAAVVAKPATDVVAKPAPDVVAKPVPAQPAPVLQPAVSAAPARIAAAPAGKGQVQLAAMTSEAAALAEWQRLAKRMPELLGGRHPDVVKAEHDGKTIWRLRTGGFDDAAAAAGFCGQVRAKGGGCAVAAF